MKVGDLVKYRHDCFSKKTYVVREVWAHEVTGNTLCNLFGWSGGAGTLQTFRADQLEVLSEGG